MQENPYSSKTLPSFFVDLDIHLGVPLTSPFKTKEADQQASPLKYIIRGISTTTDWLGLGQKQV